MNFWHETSSIDSCFVSCQKNIPAKLDFEERKTTRLHKTVIIDIAVTRKINSLGCRVMLERQTLSSV